MLLVFEQKVAISRYFDAIWQFYDVNTDERKPHNSGYTK